MPCLVSKYCFFWTCKNRSLALFFLILIALAEHIGFALAYLIASALVVGLNTLYCLAVLSRRELALLVGAVLSSTYGVLYTILVAEDSPPEPSPKAPMHPPPLAAPNTVLRSTKRSRSCLRTSCLTEEDIATGL